MKYYIPLTDEDERECIRKAQAGDKDSFGRLFEKYMGMLKGFCEEELHCNDAEDLVSVTFGKAWENIKSYEARNEAAFFTWLKTIARNHYFNLNEKKKRHTSIKLRMQIARDNIINLGKGRVKMRPDDQDEAIVKIKKNNEIMEDFLNSMSDRGKQKIAADVEERARRNAIRDCVQRQFAKVSKDHKNLVDLINFRWLCS